MGMAQVIATIAYGIRGLRRGETTWGWPDFDADPAQENLAQLSRWSLNSAPAWDFPPLAIANQYHDQQANEVKRARYRLILVRGSDLRWLNRDRLQEVKTGFATQHKWLPDQTLPFSEVVLYAYAADRTPFPTYVCLPSGLYKARLAQSRKSCLCLAYTSLMDGGYTLRCQSPTTCHAQKRRRFKISL